MKKLLFNTDSLTFEVMKIKTPKITIILSIYSVILTFVIVTAFTNKKDNIEYEQALIIVKHTESQFTEENLVNYLKSVKNLDYPHIILAQARIETKNYSSNIFKENNNLLGMRVVNYRPTFAIGINRNHAVYENWKKSIDDYVIYQSMFLKRKNLTEDDYLKILGEIYAESSYYYETIKTESSNTKLLFE